MSSIDPLSALGYAHAARETNAFFDKVTLGLVKDAGDPDQMGRLKIQCPTLGDSEDSKLEDLPWAVAIIPGGMFNIPPVGAHVAVVCLDGDPSKRMYFGEAIVDRNRIASMPHGRFVGQHGPFDLNGNPMSGFDNGQEGFRKRGAPVNAGIGCVEQQQQETPPAEQQPERTESEVTENPNAPGIGPGGTSDGEVDSKVPGTPKTPDKSHEWFSRGVFPAASAMIPEVADGLKDTLLAPIADTPGAGQFMEVVFDVKNLVDGASTREGEEAQTEQVKLEHRTGYTPDTRSIPMDSSYTGERFSPNIFSWSSPDGHGLSMNDDVKNSQMIWRSKAGSRIMVDDTGERIYIASAKGNNWVEMDEAGMIDIYGGKSISIASDRDINLYAKRKILMSAGEGIHLMSETEIRMHAKSVLHIKSDGSSYIESQGGDVHLKSSASIVTNANGMIAFKAKGGGYFQSGCALNILSSGPVYITGSEAHVNSTVAAEAPLADPASDAFVVNRAPEKEPWARGFAKKEAAQGDGGTTEEAVRELRRAGRNTSTGPNRYESLDYDDSRIGRLDEDGKEIKRNKYWRR